jgi:hypothetical protein
MITTMDSFFSLISLLTLCFFSVSYSYVIIKKITYRLTHDFFITHLFFFIQFHLELTMTDYTTSVDMQDRLLERPVDDTSSISLKSIPISTRYGYVLVTQQGPANRSVIVTYHDVGYNCMCIIDLK